jgi:hypothetical protein
MDITNSTGIDTEYRVTPRQAAKSCEPGAWNNLGANDYAVVKPLEGGPWTVEFRVRGNGSVSEPVDSPKASVVLVEAVGAYRVQASVAPIDAFIEYSFSGKSWAEKLDAALRESGVTTWFDARNLLPGDSVRSQLGKAIGEARNLVVLIGPEELSEGPRQGPRLERMLALEAVWRDPGKRLIPLLLGHPELPTFVRAASSWTRPVAAIRVESPSRDWDQAVANLIEVVKSEADPRRKGEVLDTVEEDRRLWKERLGYIKQVAAELE